MDRLSSEVIIYGTGSPILADVEESLCRAGVTMAGAVKNRPGECYLSDKSLLLSNITGYATHTPILIPLFTPAHRKMALTEATAVGFTTHFSLLDPTAILPHAVHIEPGAYINAGVVVGAGSKLGPFVFINRRAALGHHCVCGAFVSIGPGAVTGGGVTLGDGVCLGTGAVILPNIRVGANAVVGAGAVVTKDVPENCLVVGNPARIAKTNIIGYNGKGV